jgi:hypothetical protein
MNKSMGWVVVCLLGLAGCTIERFDDEDCDDDFGFDDDDSGHGATSSGGKGSAGTAPKPDDGDSGKAGTGASGSGGSTPSTPPLACEKERDCLPGYNCDFGTNECVPAAEETCAELETELSCSHRSDCVPIYGGTNCSCGQDCECKGGEPGCVCESFQFFVCQAAE